MNPFEEKAKSPNEQLQNWKTLYPKAYDKNEVDPYTKTRIILLAGAEYEANWFSHSFARHAADAGLRRDLALMRYIEKQQQIKLSMLKPIDESVLETTISYEQLAVDLTAELAQRERDINVKNSLDFALLEDFDHLYRYADLLELEHGVKAEQLVGKMTEITPARPTIAHHRYPTDNVKKHTNGKRADKQTVLNTMIITAAEQQTMNYYMNVAAFYTSERGRKLYGEIALVEEEHVTQYESLLDPKMTWLESALWHEYSECYLYYSCAMTETDKYIKKLWEQNLEYEIGHLHMTAELLAKHEKKDWRQVIPDGQFPEPVRLHENIDYIRKVIRSTFDLTNDGEGYKRVSELPKTANFHVFTKNLNEPVSQVPSHRVIDDTIADRGTDYRFEIAENSVPELRDRKKDNTDVSRK